MTEKLALTIAIIIFFNLTLQSALFHLLITLSCKWLESLIAVVRTNFSVISGVLKPFPLMKGKTFEIFPYFTDYRASLKIG